MLMYGVPFPDGEVVRPIEDEKAPAEEEAATFPDGSVAKPLTDEDAAKLLDKVHKEKEQQSQQ